MPKGKEVVAKLAVTKERFDWEEGAWPSSLARFSVASQPRRDLAQVPRGRHGKNRKAKTQAPRRLQLRRSKGWRLPANTVKVDRSTLFGNPLLAIDHGSDRVVALFRAWITGRCTNVCVPPGVRRALMRRRADMLRALPALGGKNLACWCRPPRRGEPDACHAAVLLTLVNRRSPCNAEGNAGAGAAKAKTARRGRRLRS